MDQNFQCPVCSSEIPVDRQFQDTLICQCGWTQTKSFNTTEFKQSKQTGVYVAVVAAVLLLTFMQAVNWDKYFFSIVPLKAKQWTGMASEANLNKIVEICEARHKHICVEEAYRDLHQLTDNKDYLSKLGHIQFQQKKKVLALESYEKYFQAGGKDLRSRYEYAQSLAEAGQFQQARKQYRRILKSKPGTLQFTVARSYVELLIDNDQYKAASYIIKHYRSRSKSSSYWMEKELKAINKKLGRRHASL